MGLVELLISLAISALLLTGVAAAFVASSAAVRANDEFSRAAQAARVSVNQIMSLARQCQSGVVTPSSLQLKLLDGTTRSYGVNKLSRELQVNFESMVPPELHALAHNVEDVAFSTDGATISMVVTVRVGNQVLTLNGSALPRRSVIYQ
jgi:type II secretory pathway pseudopilin PulG